MSGGTYCDVISGQKEGNNCTGKQILVSDDGHAHFKISNLDEDPFVAIHAESKIWYVMSVFNHFMFTDLSAIFLRVAQIYLLYFWVQMFNKKVRTKQYEIVCIISTVSHTKKVRLFNLLTWWIQEASIIRYGFCLNLKIY